MEALALHTIAQTVHWEGKKVAFMLFNLKYLLLELNTFTLLSAFYKRIFTMVSLSQNMKSLVLCRQICAPNHF